MWVRYYALLLIVYCLPAGVLFAEILHTGAADLANPTLDAGNFYLVSVQIVPLIGALFAFALGLFFLSKRQFTVKTLGWYMFATLGVPILYIFFLFAGGAIALVIALLFSPFMSFGSFSIWATVVSYTLVSSVVAAFFIYGFLDVLARLNADQMGLLRKVLIYSVLGGNGVTVLFVMLSHKLVHLDASLFFPIGLIVSILSVVPLTYLMHKHRAVMLSAS